MHLSRHISHSTGLIMRLFLPILLCKRTLQLKIILYRSWDRITRRSVQPIVHHPRIVLGHRKIIIQQVDLRGLCQRVCFLYCG